MRLLLDTHAPLWWIDDPARLAEEARLAVANGRNSIFISPMSILEIAIKQATGKLKVPATLLEIIAACRFTKLPLSMAHAAEVQVLPTIHKDPFDRARRPGPRGRLDAGQPRSAVGALRRALAGRMISASR